MNWNSLKCWEMPKKSKNSKKSWNFFSVGLFTDEIIQKRHSKIISVQKKTSKIDKYIIRFYPIISQNKIKDSVRLKERKKNECIYFLFCVIRSFIPFDPCCSCDHFVLAFGTTTTNKNPINKIASHSISWLHFVRRICWRQK